MKYQVWKDGQKVIIEKILAKDKDSSENISTKKSAKTKKTKKQDK